LTAAGPERTLPDVRPGFFATGTIALTAASAHAQTAPPAVDPGVAAAASNGVSLSAVGSSDVDPAPPPAIAWGSWLYPARYPGGGPMSGPQTPLFARLTLELPSVLGFRPFLVTILNTNLTNPAPSTSAGLRLREGPLELGTRFSLSRDRSQALFLNNASYARYVERTFDVGVESVRRVSLSPERRITRHELLLSAGVHPSKAAPTLRLNTALPAEGPSPRLANASLFGKF
jgi:hypothetical protein